MPFKKTGKNTYRSPSGRRMTLAQVRAYYAKTKTQGKRKK